MVYDTVLVADTQILLFCSPTCMQEVVTIIVDAGKSRGLIAHEAPTAAFELPDVGNTGPTSLLHSFLPADAVAIDAKQWPREAVADQAGPPDLS